jgi:3,4-dihydroxy 2-butanone 4-phosphate synthase/GTP cyclohydrolase II
MGINEEMKQTEFNSAEELIKAIAQGEMVIVTDDESRENEGDFIFAAEFSTPEKINFLAKHGRGLICTPLAEKRLLELGLRDMVEQNTDPKKTAFTISVDAKFGISTGISAYDRSRTIEVLLDPTTTTTDLIVPGHIFPLKAKKGGVLVRAGHTEAAVDLAVLAGCQPAGVICEIMDDDGKMARTPELFRIAKKFNLKIGTIKSLIQYRRKNERLIEKEVSTQIPNEYGKWKTHLYKSLVDGKEHMAMVLGEIGTEPTLVRVHSECFTGDVLGSVRCDCREQLQAAMKLIQQNGAGVLLYMRQEGRGIGLVNKLKAYQLQDEGYDTVEANEKLGFKPDLRDYGIGAQILADLNLKQIKLITNNPRKIVGLEGYGLEVVERVPLAIEPSETNEKYLRTKVEKLGHLM